MSTKQTLRDVQADMTSVILASQRLRAEIAILLETQEVILGSPATRRAKAPGCYASVEISRPCRSPEGAVGIVSPYWRMPCFRWTRVLSIVGEYTS